MEVRLVGVEEADGPRDPRDPVGPSRPDGDGRPHPGERRPGGGHDAGDVPEVAQEGEVLVLRPVPGRLERRDRGPVSARRHVEQVGADARVDPVRPIEHGHLGHAVERHVRVRRVDAPRDDGVGAQGQVHPGRARGAVARVVERPDPDLVADRRDDRRERGVERRRSDRERSGRLVVSPADRVARDRRLARGGRPSHEGAPRPRRDVDGPRSAREGLGLVRLEDLEVHPRPRGWGGEAERPGDGRAAAREVGEGGEGLDRNRGPAEGARDGERA